MAAAPTKSNPSKKNGQRMIRFVFTVNNWTQKEYLWLTTDETFHARIRWMIIAKETGEDGTPHLQGACLLLSQIAFSTLKTWRGFKRAHLEKMNGTPSDSLKYCSKQDSQPFVIGEMPQQGKRTELKECCDQIVAGKTLRDLAVTEQGGPCVVKFHKGLTVLRSLTRPARSDPPLVFWIYGATGTGKTREAFSISKQLSGPEDIWISCGGLRWFDGYDGQTCAIFDDFRSKGVKFDFLLRLLDRYPMQVEFKGGFVNWNPKYIFITTPDAICVTFQSRKEHLPEDIKQLERRVTKSFHFPTDVNEFHEYFELLQIEPEALGSSVSGEDGSVPTTVELSSDSDLE